MNTLRIWAGRQSADRHRRALIVLLGAAGLVFNVALFHPMLDRTLAGDNDFQGLFPGAVLAGTPRLYDRQASLDIHVRTTGTACGSLIYTRPPFYAAVLAPLRYLSYTAAARIWTMIAAVAAVAFALLWPVGRRAETILACCWSVPLFASLVQSQDAAMILLALAGGAVLLRRDRPIAAGILVAFCLVKFHLFLLMPVIVVAQRRWRLAAGLALGAACLTALSFAAAGPCWPVEYYKNIISDPRTNADPGGSMPNLHGLFHGLPHATTLEALGSIIVLLATWVVARRASFEGSLAVALAGGLLIGRHAYIHDGALLIPAGQAALSVAATPGYRLFALMLLTPAAWVPAFRGPIFITRMLLVLFVACAVYEAVVAVQRQEAKPL